jgi:hypothetical protein
MYTAPIIHIIYPIYDTERDVYYQDCINTLNETGAYNVKFLS